MKCLPVNSIDLSTPEEMVGEDSAWALMPGVIKNKIVNLSTQMHDLHQHVQVPFCINFA